MKERDDILFMDTSLLKKTEGIEKRAEEGYLLSKLKERFPEEVFLSLKVTHYEKGTYGRRPNLLEKIWGSKTLIEGLPEFYEVDLIHSTGDHSEELIVWSPVRWNGRFAGTAGGGTGIGGRSYLTAPDNTSRGWNVPYALMNGFSAATMDAKNQKGLKDLTIGKDGKLDGEIYLNWYCRSTHNMTRFGKAVTEILHGRKIEYSYMNGGSGGGRQSLVEVQRYPDDYDGVWAVCPAIHWHEFLLGGFWPLTVMKKYDDFISPEKNDFILSKVHKAYGGREAYYHQEKRPSFDARKLIGKTFEKGVISETDALVMNEIWRGPHRENGEFLWYGYYPGVKNYQVNIPIGTYYYPFYNHKIIKPFILAEYYSRWILDDPSFSWKDIDQKKLEELYDLGKEKFSAYIDDDPAIDDFVAHGGKLIIDHGMDDPLIPTEGSIDYYRSLVSRFSQEKTDTFCRLYITPGDNHGNCWGNGPGITEKAGMKALVEWVEKGITPKELRKVRVDRKTGETLEEGYQKPFSFDHEDTESR